MTTLPQQENIETGANAWMVCRFPPPHTWTSTTQRRYPWSMPENPDPPPSEDPGLSRIYDLAERLNAEITRPEPDWRAVIQMAYALGRAAQRATARSHKD